MSTTVASLGSGTATSLINLDAVKPKPATDRGLALPSLAVTDDGSGPRVRNLVLELPDLDLGAVSVASRLGDQSLPAVFRAAPLAGSALASPIRGLTFTTTGDRAVEPVLRADGDRAGHGHARAGFAGARRGGRELHPEHPPLRDAPGPDPQRLARCADERRNGDPGERRR